jgi:hypothetical protein
VKPLKKIDNTRDEWLQPDISTPPTGTGSDDMHATRWDFYTPFDRHGPTDSVASGYDKNAADLGIASPIYFLPSDGDVLEHYSQGNKFGTGAKVVPYTNRVSCYQYQTTLNYL